MIGKIVSGGQTGVDRGALDAALARNFPCGGWCPAGRRAEDGVIGLAYPVAEIRRGGYAARTARNVQDSDGTLIIFFDELEGGTRLTLEECLNQAKPHLVVDARQHEPAEATRLVESFVDEYGVRCLNVAGPRASKVPGAARYAFAVIDRLIAGHASR